jgi:hypothetical protein
LCGPVFNGAHVLAHLELEFFHQRSQLGLKIAGAIAQFYITFTRESGAF